MRLTKKLDGLTAHARAPDVSRPSPNGPEPTSPAAPPSVAPPTSVMSPAASSDGEPAVVVRVREGRVGKAESSSPREETGENATKIRSERTAHSAVSAKFENLSGQEVERSLVELLEKGPKFTLTQSIRGRTYQDVELGMERGAFALRWKIEFQRRATQGYQGLKRGSLKPRFPDGAASMPPAAPGDVERSILALKKKLMAIYRNHRSPGKNYTMPQRRAISQLRSSKDLILKPSDKCKDFVLMAREDYISKAGSHISEYEAIPRNPIPKLEAKTKRVIKDTMEGKVDEDILQAILPQCSRTAEFYGLPKKT